HAVASARTGRRRGQALPREIGEHLPGRGPAGLSQFLRDLQDVVVDVESRPHGVILHHASDARVLYYCAAGRRTGGRMRVMKPIAIAAFLVISLPLIAQQRAPRNESIRQDALRADLFFLAGDAMKGRLTDTDENRATADYIRSRFERAGLKPAANGSYFQTYNLMTATPADRTPTPIP